ncbi:MAG: class I SAM-dependent methyltransferase [Gemmatimonadaceae bacterium]|nr:class I SAM-dependent methyltransferase [Gemmatimonadaceae bacterium]
MPAALTEERRVAEAAAQGAAGKRAYVRRMFSDIAPRYDLLNHVLSLNIDKAWRTKAIAALELSRAPDGRVLDLCAGTLDVGAAITRAPGFRGTVIGADFAVPMLEGGVGKAPAHRLMPVAADALHLPVADQVFDGAIVAFGIRNLADLDAGLREVRRVCKPGSRFVILEFSTPQNPLVRMGYHAYFHHVLPAIGGLVSGHKTAYAYLPASVAHFPTGDALAQRMRDAGWQDVRWSPVSFGIAAIHVGTAPAHVPDAARGRA